MSRGKGSAIQHEAIRTLERCDSVDASRIGVSIDDEVIILTGCAASEAERTAAEQSARGIPGISSVVNMITVAPHLFPRSDAAIESGVREAMCADPALQRNPIRVSVSRGSVTLTGTVDWQFERRCAESRARSVPGVRQVENTIQVRRRMTSEARPRAEAR